MKVSLSLTHTDTFTELFMPEHWFHKPPLSTWREKRSRTDSLTLHDSCKIHNIHIHTVKVKMKLIAPKRHIMVLRVSRCIFQPVSLTAVIVSHVSTVTRPNSCLSSTAAGLRKHRLKDCLSKMHYGTCGRLAVGTMSTCAASILTKFLC